MAHEFKHVSDFVKMMQLYQPEVLENYSKQELELIYAMMEKKFPGIKAFKDKCVKAKGYIMFTDKEYSTIQRLQEEINHYKYNSITEHDAFDLEKRANKAATEELNIFRSMQEKLYLNIVGK